MPFAAFKLSSDEGQETPENGKRAFRPQTERQKAVERGLEEPDGRRREDRLNEGWHDASGRGPLRHLAPTISDGRVVIQGCMSSLSEATRITLTAEEGVELGALDQDGTPYAPQGANRADGCRWLGDAGDRAGAWLYDRHGAEVAGALRKGSARGFFQGRRGRRRAQIRRGDGPPNPGIARCAAARGLRQLDRAAAAHRGGARRRSCPIYLALFCAPKKSTFPDSSHGASATTRNLRAAEIVGSLHGPARGRHPRRRR